MFLINFTLNDRQSRFIDGARFYDPLQVDCARKNISVIEQVATILGRDAVLVACFLAPIPFFTPRSLFAVLTTGLGGAVAAATYRRGMTHCEDNCAAAPAAPVYRRAQSPPVSVLPVSRHKGGWGRLLASFLDFRSLTTAERVGAGIAVLRVPTLTVTLISSENCSFSDSEMYKA